MPTGRLLDVGSGNGNFIAVAAMRGWEAWGIEPYREAFDVTERLFSNCGARFIEGNLETFELPLPKFDVISFNEVLEHTHSPKKCLLKANELLVPGGLLVITVPDAGSVHALLHGRDWRHWDPPYHLYGFTRRVITRFLKETGFEVIKFKSNLMYAGQMLVFARKLGEKNMFS